MKKIISLILAVYMTALCALSVSAEYDLYLEQSFRHDNSFSLGDVNEDGQVDAKDALYMTANVKGLPGYEMNSEAADFTADTEFDAKDLYYMKLCLSGIASPETYGGDKLLYRLTIAGNDLSEYSFVLPEGTTDNDNAYLAYRLLFKYIRYLTGTEIPLAYGKADTEHAITFTSLCTTDGGYGEYLGTDGMKYEVVDGNLNFYGTLRGNMYAVYEMIENHLGVRFYSDSETFVYKSRVTDIPEGTSVEIIPGITLRFSKQTYSTSGALNHYFAHKLNGSYLYAYTENRFGGLTGDLYGNAHSFGYYWQMGTGTMPEDDGTMSLADRYAAKMASGESKEAVQYSWQPCATSDEDFKILFEGMLDCNRMVMSWGLREPNFKDGLALFSFSICDNQNYHSCRYCRKISGTEGYSGLCIQLYNRAAVKLQDYYPGAQVYGILYAKDIPKTILPDENLIIQYCGVSCHNHILGMEECYENGGQLNKQTNRDDLAALEYWGNACKQTGAQLWFWIYPVNYHYFFMDTPNIPNLYYNTKYLVDNFNVTGLFYEGNYDGDGYNFEALKAYMVTRLMWDTDMTYDEWNAIMKEYLYIYYGDGYEYIFEYINMQTEAGDQCGTCFVNNFDRPGDMYSYEYLAENYGEMRGLLESALALAQNDEQIRRVENLLICCDFMALSSLHTDWYVNGNNTELYKERYSWMLDKMHEYDMIAFSSSLYSVPAECDFEENPMIQFYGSGSRRPDIYP